MPLIEINRNPDAKSLRWFVLLWLPLALALLGFMAYRKHGFHVTAGAFWGAALILPIAGLISARFARWMWIGWMTAVYPIGFVVSHLVLLLIWFAVITPVGLMLRLAGFDPMRKKFDRRAASYWEECSPHSKRERYFRQF